MNAEAEATQTGEVGFKGPGGFGAWAKGYRMRDLIWLPMAVGIGYSCITLYNHEATAQSQRQELATTLKESNKVIADALKDSTAAQKERDSAFIQAVKELSAEQKKMTVQVTIANCMNEPAMKNRPDAREACRRIIRDNQ